MLTKTLKNILSIAGGITLVLVSSTLSATVIATQPTAIANGDQYRLAFVTSVKTDAVATDISYYNDFVTSLANAQTALAALGTTWSVIGSTADISARDNTGTNPDTDTGVAIYLLNGTTKIADNNADLWDGTLDAYLNIDETGTTRNGYTYTGSNIDGTAATYGYLGTPYDYVFSGVNVSTNNWTAAEAPIKTSLRYLYAISGILPVPVPTPAGLILLLTGLAGVVLGRRQTTGLV